MGNKYSKEDTKKFIEKYDIDTKFIDESKDIPLVKDWLPIPVELTESQYKKFMDRWEKNILNPEAMIAVTPRKENNNVLSKAKENLIISSKYVKKKQLIEEEDVFLDELYNEVRKDK